jgi:hypothetical protein
VNTKAAAGFYGGLPVIVDPQMHTMLLTKRLRLPYPIEYCRVVRGIFEPELNVLHSSCGNDVF